jgi:putative flippase GtrA/4-amino-4-deoxy-L-arabinose transferase-like glycosyltransferase
VTAERTLPEAPHSRIGSGGGTISPTPPDLDLVTQLDGFDALEALSMTEPLRTANVEMPVRSRRVARSSAHGSALHRLASRAWTQRLRLVLFAVNGMNVFAVGLLIQVLLVRYLGMGHISSYIAQTVVSVQISFLLSRFLTWRDRDVAFVPALAKFNVQQLVVTGLGMAGYAGLERIGMNYIAANVAITAVLTPVSFLSGHKWSMRERSHLHWRATPFPWPLLAVLGVQVILALRLIWRDTPFIDEATYLYAGSQELNHWMHGGRVEDFQTVFSGSPAVYPPIGALANAIGGLTAARLLSLVFMLGTTTLLYFTTGRLFGRQAALMSAVLFVALGVTQFLSVLATYDAMTLFLLALSSYLVIGRRINYDSLSAVAASVVIAPTVLALANAAKYATALWDPIVIGLVLCAPVVANRTWRYGLSMATRFSAVLSLLLATGLAIGKSKYIQGILYTTLNRSSQQVGMGQSPSLVLHDALVWVGLVVAIAVVGALLLFLSGARARFAVPGILLVLAAVAAPLNQARIGTSTSLQKHVVFGAWFGCILAGYALTRLLRYRPLILAGATALLIGLSSFYTSQATSFVSWPAENPAFIAGLKQLVHPGSQKYLIEGYDDIPAYYIGSVSSIQWKEAGDYSYIDPQTAEFLLNGPALTDAIRHRVFTLVILNFTHATPNEPSNDYAVADAIARYGGYRIIGHLPPSAVGSHDTYTVWGVMGGQQ